jgi:hypothetical protein
VIRIAPETPSELYARARFRDSIAAEFSERGLYEEAARHWSIALDYRRTADLIAGGAVIVSAEAIRALP